MVDKPANDDRLWNVRPIIDRVMKRCRELPVEENICVDEQIVPFKGQLNIKQYLQNKPCKWGIKVFLLCGASGLVYDGIVYQGKTTPLKADYVDEYGITGAIVVQLSDRVAPQLNHKLFADNYFTSIALIRYLSSQGIWYAGTITTNRLMQCPLSNLKKSERGTIEEHVTFKADVVVGHGMLTLPQSWGKVSDITKCILL